MVQPQHHLQFCTAHYRRSPLIWPHKPDHGNSTLPQKGAHLNTLGKFHIHIEFVKNNHLNDPQTIHPNAIFDTLIKTDWPLNPTTARPPHPDYRHSQAPNKRTRPFTRNIRANFHANNHRLTTINTELENTQHKLRITDSHITWLYSVIHTRTYKVYMW